MPARNLILIFLTFTLLFGCVEKTHWKSYDQNSRSQFERDRAACQLEAKGAHDSYRGRQSGSLKTTHEGNYDPDSGQFSATSKTTYEENHFAKAANILGANAEFDDVYKLCMKSRGYYKSNNTSSVNEKSNTENKLKYQNDENEKDNNNCKDTFDCAKNLVCDNGTCREKFNMEKNNLSENNDKYINCKDSFDCDKGYNCYKNKCINSLNETNTTEYKLNQLKDLYEKNLISEKEYESKKLEILNSL
jgi:hypothetical protein